jgi:hypothetical protein
MTTGRLARFLIVTLCWPLVEPTLTLPNARDLGVIRNWGVPWPLKRNEKAWPFQVPLVVPGVQPVVVGEKA